MTKPGLLLESTFQELVEMQQQWNLDKNKENSRLGWICRDEKGHVLCTGARAVTRSTSTIITEIKALKWAAETLAGVGYKNIIFESDSLTLVKRINGVEEAVWS